MAATVSNPPTLPVPYPSPASVATPTFKNPWSTAIPADSHKQQESDLPFPTERTHYRRPHLI